MSHHKNIPASCHHARRHVVGQIQLHTFLNLASDGEYVETVKLGPFDPGEISLANHWMGPRIDQSAPARIIQRVDQPAVTKGTVTERQADPTV